MNSFRFPGPTREGAHGKHIPMNSQAFGVAAVKDPKLRYWLLVNKYEAVNWSSSWA